MWVLVLHIAATNLDIIHSQQKTKQWYTKNTIINYNKIKKIGKILHMPCEIKENAFIKTNWHSRL